MMALLMMTGFIAALDCPGQPPAKQPEASVQITVVVILASDRCKCIDPRLAEIACELQKAHPKLTGFTVVSMTKMSLPADGKGKFVCIEDTCVEVVVRKCVDANNKVCLQVTAPLQDKVVYDTICGKFCLIMTRYKVPEQIPPTWVAQALGRAIGGGPVAGPLMAAGTLLEGRTRARLVLAICAQPCNGK